MISTVFSSVLSIASQTQGVRSVEGTGNGKFAMPVKLLLQKAPFKLDALESSGRREITDVIHRSPLLEFLDGGRIMEV